MAEGFLGGLLEMSSRAAMAVCVVLAVRGFFAWVGIPKKYAYILWAIPFLRMVIPWWTESPLSVFGPLRAMTACLPGFWGTGGLAAGAAEGGMGSGGFGNLLPPPNQASTGTLPREAAAWADSLTKSLSAAGADWQAGLPEAAVLTVWAAGVCGMWGYCICSYLKMKKRIKCGVHVSGNLYLADHIGTPFVFGMVSPKIYLPSDMEEEDMRYAVLHERVHIRRGDHLVKMAAFLTVSVHWFNPLCWIAFCFMGRDMEMSCDEAVIRGLETSKRREYAIALLKMTVAGARSWGIPPAFGQLKPEGRIRRIMTYRRTAKSAVAAGAVITALAAAVLLTNPLPVGRAGAAAFTEYVRTGILSHRNEGDELVFSYNGKKYDLRDRAGDVNAIVNCQEAGRYIIVKGHIGPHNGYYGIFNTITEEFEKDIFGANLAYEGEGGSGADLELSDFVYSFQNEIYDGNGSLIASCRLEETEEIYGLRVEEGKVYADVMDIEAGAVVRTELVGRLAPQ